MVYSVNTPPNLLDMSHLQNIIRQYPSSLTGTFTTTSTAYSQLAFNILIPKKEVFGVNETKVYLSVAATIWKDSAATSVDVEIYNYLTGASVAGTQVSGTSNTAQIVYSPYGEITDGGVFRVRVKKTGGAGSTNVYIHSFTIFQKILLN